jgi:1-acyl-sn-glycerol-3-phosphate acyltransferase
VDRLAPLYRVRSGIAYLIACLYTMLVGPPALVWTFVSGRTGDLLALGCFGARQFRTLLGIRLQVEGLDRIVGDRPAVYCINHRSNVDVVAFEALYGRCPRLRGIYKAELGRLPILGRVLRSAGFVPVDRAHHARAMAAADEAVRGLRAGDSFLVAPEGTRAPTDDLLPFKKGAFIMAITAQAPVVPVALIGTAEAMPRGRAWVKPARVRVVVGEPIPTAGLTLADRDALADTLRGRLQALLRC